MQCQRSNAGFILFSVLSLTLCLAAFALLNVQALYFMAKILQQRQIYQKNFIQFEQLAYDLIQNKRLTCVREGRSLLNITRLTQQQGCLVEKNNQQYRYLMFDLGIWPCLVIKSQNHLVSSHHWIINIIQQKPLRFLYVRVASPHKKGMQCEDQRLRIIPAGVVSWFTAPTQ